MTQCSNCNSDSVYIYEPVVNVKMYYCPTHLPAFIRRSGLMNVISKVEGFAEKVQASAEVISKISKKKSTKITIDKSPAVVDDVELDSTQNDTTEEVTNSESNE